VYLRAGRYSRAEPLLARSLAIFEKAYDPQQRDVAVALENYALVLRKLKRETEADALLERRKKALKP
jgi:hypothetical protein